jgi:hypothetical protein
MLGGITRMRQKQGNTEAGPVGRKSVGVTLNFLILSLPQYLIIVKTQKICYLIIHNMKLKRTGDKLIIQILHIREK